MQFNKYFVHEIKPRKYALITDVGNWLPVSGKELNAIKNGRIGKKLEKRLEGKKIIVTEKNKKAIVDDYRTLYDHLTHGISLHIINPTMRCNQSCSYCYAKAVPMQESKADMSIETAKKTIDFIWQSPKKSLVIEFQGGEPLANLPTIQFIVDYASKKRPKKKIYWRMVSNFSLMDETIASWLKKNNVLDLCTSLDGPKKVHDRNRPLHGGSYRKVVYWLQALRQDFGFKKIGALCTVTRYSLPYARETVEEYLNQGLHDITPVALRETGRAKKNWQGIGYSPQQYLQFWKEMVDYCIQSTRKGRTITEQFTLMMLQKLDAINPSYHSCFSRPCGAALMQCSYQPDGSIYTCDEGKSEQLFKLGTVKQPYGKVFTSPNALNMVSLSSALGMLCNECTWTAYCSFCPVIAYTSQNSPLPLLYNNFECNIRKGQFPHVLERLFSKDKAILHKWLGLSKPL